MCGIAAIFIYQGDSSRVDIEELNRMREAMKLRGPDSAGTWVSSDGSAGLAHRRLSIIDLSETANQPMAAEDGSIHIVFNGEIYNFRQLRADLEKKGCRFRSNSDTEVLLRLYSEKGASMVYDLRGMYAFVIYDALKRGLLLARDPFGIKPLYYSDDGKTIRIASQVKALIKGGHIDKCPEPAGHAGFFLWGHVPEPYTLYKKIRALPAGSTLWIDEKRKPQIGVFFNISQELAQAKPASGNINENELREKVNNALADSVQHHLISDVPVGILLSSGIDSNTVASLAARTSADVLRTFTLGFKEYIGSEIDETALAEELSKRYATRHETRWITKEVFFSKLPHLLEAMDQPSIDGVNMYCLSSMVSERGIKTALSGLGGDELFAGYPGFKQIPKLVHTLAPIPILPVLAKGFRLVSLPVLKRFTSPKYAGLLEYGRSFAGAYFLRRGLFMPWELPGLIDIEMVKEGWRELQPIIRLEEILHGERTDHAKIMALEMSCYMRNQLLRDADWAGMANSLEIRVPLVDVKLLRALAPLLVSDSPPTKLDMAGLLNPPLPHRVLSRPKITFNVPVNKWAEELPDMAVERGLRGWARWVYARFL